MIVIFLDIVDMNYIYYTDVSRPGIYTIAASVIICSC